METAWIQVFILTLAQCVAPAGKVVCQEEIVEYQFSNMDDCERARVQLVDLAGRADNVLVDAGASTCRAAARESSIFASADQARAALGGSEDFVLIAGEERAPDFTATAHSARLANTKTCEETRGVAPCKVGEIILEAATESAEGEVWRRRN